MVNLWIEYYAKEIRNSILAGMMVHKLMIHEVQNQMNAYFSKSDRVTFLLVKIMPGHQTVSPDRGDGQKKKKKKKEKKKTHPASQITRVNRSINTIYTKYVLLGWQLLFCFD